MDKTLDVICIGRAAVDLYGQQLGGRLEDMQSFAKYLGGSSANLAAGLARLGVRSSMLTRVGNEQMGSFVREALAAEGVDVSHVVTDPRRLTALVILGISGADSFPHIFYRENCADLAIDLEDFDAAYIASSRALSITGTHLSTPSSRKAVLQAVRYARRNGTSVILDIDYRPVLWGLVDPGSGEERYIASATATETIGELLPDCDLVVGTEEEIQIAGGDDATFDSLHNIRRRSQAVLVVKRGPIGCSVFEGPIPAQLDDGVSVPGVKVDVLNTLGAGDAFLSGFLHGWLNGASWSRCAELGNACGALVVSRHGCTPAMPTRIELERFMARSAAIARPADDSEIDYLHRVTTRRNAPDELFVLAFDQRRSLEEAASACGADGGDIRSFKSIVCSVAKRIGLGDPGQANLGVMVDERYGEAILSDLTNRGWWVGRPVAVPGSRPVQFEPGNNVGLHLANRPRAQIVTCRIQYHPDDPIELRLEQEQLVGQLCADCDALGREMLLEVETPAGQATGNGSAFANSIRRFYNLGVFPAWWMLPPQTADTWRKIGALIQDRDPYCNGVLVSALDTAVDDLARTLGVAAPVPVCKGFAMGRHSLDDVAFDWFAGTIGNDAAAARIAQKFEQTAAIWRKMAQVSPGDDMRSPAG